MALDRIVTLRFKRFAPNFFNEIVEVDPIDYRVWAEKRGAGSSDQVTEAGVQVANVAAYTVRYFKELVDEPVTTLFLLDEEGVERGTLNVSESDARRRFVELQVIGGI